MRRAVAIGVGLDGEREPDPESPWLRSIDYGEAHLMCRWPASIAALRGAVIAALGGQGDGGAHIDMHNHAPDGSTRQVRSTVCYREGPRVWAYGPRALDHLENVARIRSLRTSQGSLVSVDEVHLSTGRMDVGIHKDEWYRYEFVTPYFCPDRAYGRRLKVRDRSIELDAWSGYTISRSISAWMRDLGIDGINRAAHAHIVDIKHVHLQWRNQEQFARTGFLARFVSNAILPPGVGLGQHVSEGYGEVRPWV